MDTIAAVATPQTVSAIGILRLSGPNALAIADRVFRPDLGGPLSARSRRTMVYGTLLDREGAPIDRVLAVAFAAGSSYTGEDSAEFHCHGSPVVLREGLEALFAAGARQAKGGEFTQRAFLNGCLDLTQAEAVIDLIEAETAAAARNALGQLEGSLRRKIERIYDGLLEVASRFYAVVDYPDEDIEDLERSQLASALENAQSELETLTAAYRRGKVLKDGVPVAILGRPNVGKSSLLNALAGYERAIVTDVPGTTRDTVEEKVVMGGVLMRLIDTAGIRDTGDPVERLGVERSRAAMERAELIFVVLDVSQPAEAEDIALVRQATVLAPTILVLNKADLPPVLELGEGLPPRVLVSARTGAGLAELEEAAAARFSFETVPAGQFLTNPRQAEAVGRALAAVNSAAGALAAGMTPDAVLADAEAGLSALGELTGRTLREDLTARIFERFCVGK